MDLKALFDSFYDKLILRDLFGKIIPAIIFIFAIITVVFGLDTIPRLIDNMTFPLWMVVIGFAWLIGFALQYVGEVTRLLLTHPVKPDSRESRQSFYPKWAKFQNIAKHYEKLHAERLNVIREACGNAAISLLITALIFFGKLLKEGKLLHLPVLFLLTLIVIVAFCLWRMHVIHLKIYGEFIENTIQF